MDETNKIIGRRIKAARILQKYSRERVARRIGVSQQQLHKYEEGLNNIHVSRLAEIARALKRPLSYFLDD